MAIDNRPKIVKETGEMIFLISSFLLALGIGGCSGWYIQFRSPDIPPAPCLIEDLLLDLSAFPGNEWEETGSRSQRDAPVRMGVERIGTAFSMRNGGILQAVYRIDYEDEAKKAYKDSVESWFTPSEYETEYAIPIEISNLTVVADEYQTGCNDLKSGGFEQCQYVARYGPYIIRLFAHMRALTYEDFIDLVHRIDQNATICLDQQR